MENIFSCSLQVNGESVEYHVVFENEKYIFAPVANSKAPTFNIIREEDEWKSKDHTDQGLSTEAIAALEDYLLSQH
jgi:hypothetical protein